MEITLNESFINFNEIENQNLEEKNLQNFEEFLIEEKNENFIF